MRSVAQFSAGAPSPFLPEQFPQFQHDPAFEAGYKAMKLSGLTPMKKLVRFPGHCCAAACMGTAWAGFWHCTAGTRF
jgi:hypothetical protein